ncbi:MAG TPA: hypothetical protein VN577_16520 [Terriglobales bacterium]|nr:hypothetical protein [Terriglobales bacterium]
MKLKVLCFVLAASMVAFGQGRGGGRPSGSMGSGNAGGMGQSGMGQSGMGQSGMDHGGMGMPGSTTHGNRPDMQQAGEHQNTNVGKQSPDTILSKDTKLSSNLEKLLPSGTTAQQACSGYRNLGQCVAAIHVSNNLGIPFADLKAKTTGSSSLELGKAIHELKPEADAKAEMKKAKSQAKTDLSTASNPGQ